MIRLHPFPESNHTCPYCEVPLEVKGWYIPGMRNLADLKCHNCLREFYGDLPSGHGLYYPMILEKNDGRVHDENNVKWFADWLEKSYTQRINSPIQFKVEEFNKPVKPILLNCLDTLYGHSLLKLLNAQYYIDKKSDFDLIVLIPKFLRWMVPRGVAAIWTVDLPLKRGIEWNEWLAGEINRRIEKFDECWLSLGLSHPHPKDYDIERFTGIHPFQLKDWDKKLVKKSIITFIWRGDRIWTDNQSLSFISKIIDRVKSRLDIHRKEQERRIIKLADYIRKEFPEADFAVVGLDSPGGLPHRIRDMRTSKITDEIEKGWCKRYSHSHVVIGVHGSNMLLPSAHAGAVVELVPIKRWSNLIQDILPKKGGDVREALFRYRFIPMNTSVSEVGEMVISLLNSLPTSQVNFTIPWVDHKKLQRNPFIINSFKKT